jgi:hypothetical protein
VSMSKLQSTVRQYLTPILLLLLAGGYLVILGELFLYRHWDGVQLIGFAATVIGLVAVLLGLFAKGGLRIGLAILLAVVSISGLIGTYQHFESRSEEGEALRPTYAEASVNFNVAYRPGVDSERTLQQEGGEEGESGEAGEGQGGERGEGEGEEVPPPLAPLSLAGLSLMGAAVLLAVQDPVKR